MAIDDPEWNLFLLLDCGSDPFWWTVEVDMQVARGTVGSRGFGQAATDQEEERIRRWLALSAEGQELLDECFRAIMPDDQSIPEEISEWYVDAWRACIADGQTTHRALKWGAAVRYAMFWVSAAVFGAAAVVGFLRGAQVGAYRRMLRRHESGRCPHCDYDISAAPDHACPECGCDHRARRAEAVEALQRARR